jgi:phosphoglucomutase
MLMERIFDELGIEVIGVPEQREPDSEFSTVESPNPEEPAAMKMAIEVAEKENADLVLATDPDSDRLGIALADRDGFTLLNGNQLGSLLADYIFSTLSELDRMPANPVLVKTIVTTELQTLIAENYGATVYNTLTGFKYIADRIRYFETTGENYVFGGEESYGYLVGTEVRDKDAIGAAAMCAEMALYDISRGLSVLDHLNELYRTYGYFKEILLSRTFEGQAGQEQINTIMLNLRQKTPQTFGGSTVVVQMDYLTGISFNLQDGTRKEIGLPKSNVLQFITEDNSIISVRPSGTEPKIKFYASCRGKPGAPLEQVRAEVDARIESIRSELQNIT